MTTKQYNTQNALPKNVEEVSIKLSEEVYKTSQKEIIGKEGQWHRVLCRSVFNVFLMSSAEKQA